MASMTKRRFKDEFKHEAVALLEMSGRMQTEVASSWGSCSRCCVIGSVSGLGSG